jgi:hypothetical protein
MIHVLRTGRPYWWFWILLSAPLIGGLIYLFIEVLPENRGAGSLSWLAALKPRSWRIREARRALEESDTVKARLTLAAELLEAGQGEEAHQIAVESLKGVFKDDPHTMAEVARYNVELARWGEALTLLDRVNVRADRMLAMQVTFLKGRALLGLERFEEAEQCFREIEGRYIGAAPHYYLACALQATDRTSEAVQIWRDMRVRFRKAGPAWRRTERPWYKLATERLKELAE